MTDATDTPRTPPEGLADDLIDAHLGLAFDSSGLNGMTGQAWDRIVARRFYGLGLAVGAQLIPGPASEVESTRCSPLVGEATPEMVAAYLKANDAYWKRTDELPQRPDKWRNGTPAEATAEGLRAVFALAASPSKPPPPEDAKDEPNSFALSGDYETRMRAYLASRGVPAPIIKANIEIARADSSAAPAPREQKSDLPTHYIWQSPSGPRTINRETYECFGDFGKANCLATSPPSGGVQPSDELQASSRCPYCATDTPHWHDPKEVERVQLEMNVIAPAFECELTKLLKESSYSEWLRFDRWGHPSFWERNSEGPLAGAFGALYMDVKLEAQWRLFRAAWLAAQSSGGDTAQEAGDRL